MRIQLRTLRGTATFVLLLALINLGNINLTSVWAATIENPMVGQLAVSGSVTVNDKKAITGTSVYDNSRVNVACANGNRAIVNLGKLGRVEMAPGSQMVLKFSDGIISGDLVMGKIIVNSPVGVKVAINTPDGVSAADGKDVSTLSVTTQRGVRCVPVMTTSQGSSTFPLGTGALAAILLGTGGVAVAGVIGSTQGQASSTKP